ncbi:MAG: hypothetical protein RI911_578 [Candidatus Parcubacteria bacterium]|jgi:hypothetical protein
MKWSLVIVCAALLWVQPLHAANLDHTHGGGQGPYGESGDAYYDLDQNPPRKYSPPFDFTNVLVIRKMGCINNVLFFRVKEGRKKIDLLFSPKFSQGNVKKVKPGKRISGSSDGRTYFCIESVLPLIVHPGHLVESLE